MLVYPVRSTGEAFHAFLPLLHHYSQKIRQAKRPEYIHDNAVKDNEGVHERHAENQ